MPCLFNGIHQQCYSWHSVARCRCCHPVSLPVQTDEEKDYQIESWVPDLAGHIIAGIDKKYLTVSEIIVNAAEAFRIVIKTGIIEPALTDFISCFRVSFILHNRPNCFRNQKRGNSQWPFLFLDMMRWSPARYYSMVKKSSYPKCCPFYNNVELTCFRTAPIHPLFESFHPRSWTENPPSAFVDTAVPPLLNGRPWSQYQITYFIG